MQCKQKPAGGSDSPLIRSGPVFGRCSASLQCSDTWVVLELKSSLPESDRAETFPLSESGTQKADALMFKPHGDPENI